MNESFTGWSSSPEECEQDQAGETQSTSTELVAAPAKRLRPRACRIYLRRHVAAEWSSIVANLLIKAKDGSVSHINLAAKLAGFDFRPEPQQKQKPQEKSFAKQLLEEIQELEEKNIAEFGPL